MAIGTVASLKCNDVVCCCYWMSLGGAGWQTVIKSGNLAAILQIPLSSSRD
jgi:hypothetical protein